MSEFAVQSPALRELAGLLNRAAEDAQAARKHLDHAENIDGEGLINRISGSHQAVVQTLDAWLGQLADETFTGAATAVTDAAAYYDSTDQASAAQLDATYPASYLGDAREHTDYVPIEPPEGTGRFGDVVEPQEHLHEVKDYYDKLNASPGWWEAGSPMALFGAAIEATSWVAVQLNWLDHPFDLQAEVVKPFVGDWAGVRAAADVFGDLSDLCRTTAINVNWASQGTEEVWQGRAGEGCALHLMNVGRSVHDAWKPLDELSKQYRTASEEMVTFRDAVVNVINEIGDAAISAAFAAGISGGAAATGVGAPIAVLPALYAGWKIERVLAGIRQILDYIGKYEAAMSVVKAAQTEFGGLAGQSRMPRITNLPEMPR